MRTKSQPLRMQSAVEELGAQVKDDDKVWSLDHRGIGERTNCSLFGEYGKGSACSPASTPHPHPNSLGETYKLGQPQPTFLCSDLTTY